MLSLLYYCQLMHSFSFVVWFVFLRIFISIMTFLGWIHLMQHVSSWGTQWMNNQKCNKLKQSAFEFCGIRDWGLSTFLLANLNNFVYFLQLCSFFGNYNLMGKPEVSLHCTWLEFIIKTLAKLRNFTNYYKWDI